MHTFSGNTPIRVWVGAIKLDNRHPTKHALQAFMYGTPSNSADGADVIALYLTDLFLDQQIAEEIRHLLSKTVRNPEDYIFNEEVTAVLYAAAVIPSHNTTVPYVV